MTAAHMARPTARKATMTDTRAGHPSAWTEVKSVWSRVKRDLKSPAPSRPWEAPYASAFRFCLVWAVVGVALPWVNYSLAVGGFTVPSDLTADARMAEEQSVQTMREVTRLVAIVLSYISAFVGLCGLYLLSPAAPTAQTAIRRIQRWRQLIALNATLLVTAVTLLVALGDLNIAAPLLAIVLMGVLPLLVWFIAFALETRIEATESPTS